MHDRSWVLQHIAEATRVRHADADGHRLAILQAPTARRYRAFLRDVHGFEAPIEAAFRATTGFDGHLLETHLRAGHLETDLDMLGASPQPSPIIPRFASPAEAYGWLYVLVRNTLFHGLILRQLTAEIPETICVASAYLRSFDGLVGTRFRELGVALDAYASRTSTGDWIVAGARAAFRTQRQWYRCDPPPVMQRAA